MHASHYSNEESPSFEELCSLYQNLPSQAGISSVASNIGPAASCLLDISSKVRDAQGMLLVVAEPQQGRNPIMMGRTTAMTSPAGAPVKSGCTPWPLGLLVSQLKSSCICYPFLVTPLAVESVPVSVQPSLSHSLASLDY